MFNKGIMPLASTLQDALDAQTKECKICDGKIRK